MRVISLSFAARVAVFMLGVMFVAFGVSFSTKGMLGTSPISAIPYSLSLYFSGISFGQWVIIFNLGLLLAELALLKFRLSLYNALIQMFLACFFGCVIDLSMLVLASYQPEAYLHKIISVVIGCFLMAFGVCLDILTNISILPGDGFVLAISTRLKKDLAKSGSARISPCLLSRLFFACCCLGAPRACARARLSPRF